MSLCTPRDWQQIALREAADLLGTHEGAAKLAESKRYGACADEIDRLRAVLAEWMGLELRGHTLADHCQFTVAGRDLLCRSHAVLGTEPPGCCRYEAAPGVESEGGEA